MINYKLAKQIGATHHIDSLLYKFNDDGFAMCYFTEYGWEKTENDAAHMAELERIDFNKQKPRTRTEYEKVTESIFDLRDEFERGELFTKKAWGEYVLIKKDTHLAYLYELQSHENSTVGIYRRVEVEIDERQEFIGELSKIQKTIGDCQLGEFYNAIFESGKFKFIG